MSGMSFEWSVSGGIEALSVLAGVRFDRVFTDLDAIVSAFREGGRIAREWFGPDIPFGGPRWAGISFGIRKALAVFDPGALPRAVYLAVQRD